MVRSMTAAGAVPHFHLMDELALTRLVALRAELKGDPAMASGRLTFLPFFLKARPVHGTAFLLGRNNKVSYEGKVRAGYQLLDGVPTPTTVRAVHSAHEHGRGG